MSSHFNWDENPDLNITPLVDIMLVLLAILMVTAPVVVYQEEITLPRGSKSSKVQEDSKIEIRIDKNQVIYIKDNTYTLKEFADSFALFSNGYDKNTQVSIRADKHLLYDHVMHILKTVKETGFIRIALVTDG